MKKLFFLTQSEIMTGGVIEAQVIASLRAQTATPGQPETRLIFLESASEARKPQVRAKFKEFKSFWPEGRMSLAPFVGRFGGDDAPARSLALALARERFSRDELIFHCRGPQATLSAARARKYLKKGRVIFDVRGASAFEAIHRQGFPWRENLSAAAEKAWEYGLAEDRAAAQAADELFVVSPGLKRYATDYLGVAAERVTIVPSCVAGPSYSAENRRAARKRWAARDDAPILLYSGRLGPERLPQLMFRLFRAMLDKNPAAKLVILSYLNQLNNLTDLREAAGVPETAIIVDELSRDEVIKTLPGADVAAIFLEPALRFQLAVPIKLAEYLGAGLPLVVNNVFEWIPDLIKERGIGWTLDHEGPEEALKQTAQTICRSVAQDRAGLRERALATCEEHFVWPRYIPAMRRAYGLE
jgi:glycosyltransferase involved in cell wall biosynthesis